VLWQEYCSVALSLSHMHTHTLLLLKGNTCKIHYSIILVWVGDWTRVFSYCSYALTWSSNFQPRWQNISVRWKQHNSVQQLLKKLWFSPFFSICHIQYGFKIKKIQLLLWPDISSLGHLLCQISECFCIKEIDLTTLLQLQQ